MPGLERIHDVHDILTLRGKPCDGLALDDRLASAWINDTREDGWTVADSPHNSAIGIHF